jgi:hypothetical protein
MGQCRRVIGQWLRFHPTPVTQVPVYMMLATMFLFVSYGSFRYHHHVVLYHTWRPMCVHHRHDDESYCLPGPS